LGYSIFPAIALSSKPITRFGRFSRSIIDAFLVIQRRRLDMVGKLLIRKDSELLDTPRLFDVEIGG
jgi:hypothetical protein